MAAECCSSCEYQRTVGYPSTSWASCLYNKQASGSVIVNTIVIQKYVVSPVLIKSIFKLVNSICHYYTGKLTSNLEQYFQ